MSLYEDQWTYGKSLGTSSNPSWLGLELAFGVSDVADCAKTPRLLDNLFWETCL